MYKYKNINFFFKHDYRTLTKNLKQKILTFITLSQKSNKKIILTMMTVICYA